MINWKYLKWCLKQPRVRLIYDNYYFVGGRLPAYDQIKVYIGKKLMYSEYRDESGIRFNWIEKL